MHEITSVEINKAIAEIQGKLVNGRLRKFYDLGEGAFRFLFYQKSGNIHVYCKLLTTFNETKFTESADNATAFAMGVRKRLENATLTSIKQMSSDRIIVMEFGQEGYRLVIEMFGKGNMILINAQNRIELCYRAVRYRERSVNPGNPYEFPGSKAIPFDSIDREELARIFESVPKDKKLIRYLGDFINIGPIYLEDIIRRSGLDPGGVLNDSKYDSVLVDETLAFFERIKTEKPRLYKEEGVPKDFAIVDVERYKGFESVEYHTLNELLDEIYLGERSERVDEGKDAAKSKIRSNIEAQKELAISTKAESVYYAKVGNKIFHNMKQINDLIAYLQKNRNAKLEEVRKAFGEMKIKELDLKNKIVKIELEE